MTRLARAANQVPTFYLKVLRIREDTGLQMVAAPEEYTTKEYRAFQSCAVQIAIEESGAPQPSLQSDYLPMLALSSISGFP